jgi:hypothetical protein
MKRLTTVWLICMVALVLATVALFYGIAELTGFTAGDWPSIAILSEVILGILVYCWFVSQSKEVTEEEHKRAIWISSIFGIVTASLIILLIIDQINVGHIIEIIVLLGLVLITAKYVIKTGEIAKFTKEQAEEMRLQRSEAKPFVVPDTAPTFGREFLKSIAPGIILVKFPVSITNVGNAAAVELELSLTLPDKIDAKYEHLTTKLPTLMRDRMWKYEFSYAIETTTDETQIENVHPPEGKYELKVTFKSATSNEGTRPSEVTLPFKLSWPDWAAIRVAWLMKIEKDNFIKKLVND